MILTSTADAETKKRSHDSLHEHKPKGTHHAVIVL